jgi:hypothetical protein
VPASVTEYRYHQVRGAVHDLRALEKRRRRTDKAAETDHPHHLVEIAERGLELREQVDRAGLCRLLAILNRYLSTELTLGDEFAVGAEAQLAGDNNRFPVRTEPT